VYIVGGDGGGTDVHNEGYGCAKRSGRVGGVSGKTGGRMEGVSNGSSGRNEHQRKGTADTGALRGRKEVKNLGGGGGPKEGWMGSRVPLITDYELQDTDLG
jgi:hypothetical protein